MMKFAMPVPPPLVLRKWEIARTIDTVRHVRYRMLASGYRLQ